MHDEIRQGLNEVESRIRGLREERARLKKVFDSAKAAYTESLAAGGEDNDSAARAAAMGAKSALDQVDQKLADAQEDQLGLLRRLGDRESGVAGFASPGLDGWNEAARKLSLADGDLRIDVPGASLIQAQVQAPSLPSSPSDGSFRVASQQPATVPSASIRYLYPVFSQSPFGGPGDLNATDYTVQFDQTELTGVERDPDQTSPAKATITPTIALANPSARTFAVVLDAVPARVFDSQGALRQLLGVEMARQLDQAIDAHTVDVIENASPPSGSTGTDLVTKIRNAISDMRDLGGEPSVIALTPSDAASLDLSVQPGTGDYIFATRISGEGSPVWSVVVREVPTITNPTLIDPNRLGVLYAGDGSVLVDPFGPNLKTNQVSVRTEVEARMHVRNIEQGAFVIA
jgi:hypothetical protein